MLKPATCEICGWHGPLFRHKPEQCAINLQIKKLYLSGLTSREVGLDLGIHAKTVLNALKSTGVKARARGGNNNPYGINR